MGQERYDEAELQCRETLKLCEEYLNSGGLSNRQLWDTELNMTEAKEFLGKLPATRLEITHEKLRTA